MNAGRLALVLGLAVILGGAYIADVVEAASGIVLLVTGGSEWLRHDAPAAVCAPHARWFP